MDFESALLENHSLATISKIKKAVNENPKRFNELMTLSLKGGEIAPRASWAALHSGEKKISLLKPWIGKMISAIGKPIHSSVKRNFIRLLQDIEIPAKYQSELFEICLKLMTSAPEPIAVKVFSMSVASNIVKLHPGLKDEYTMILSEVLQLESAPAIQSRGRKIVKSLSKLK